MDSFPVAVYRVSVSSLVSPAAASCLLCISLATATAQQAGAPPPAPVVVAPAATRMLAPITWYPGTVISRNQARLAAEVEGRLVWVAEVGSTVAGGEEVARLDDVILRQTLAEHEAAVAREQSQLAFLEAEVERLEKLLKRNTATQSQYEQRVADRGVTRSQLAAAGARVELTRERLERTTLRAPFAGIVAERHLQAGEWAESGSAVVRLVDMDSLEVQAWVPVHTLKHLDVTDELQIKANPRDTSGTIRTIVPVGDDRSRLYELRLTLASEGWPVGQSVRVAIPADKPREVVAVPRDALVLRRDGTSVYRIKADETAERVAVSTGIAAGSVIEVVGIESGDRVVTRGGERLRPGQKVRVIDQGDQP